MREGYAVTVSRWGEGILTIEREMLSGNPDLSDGDQRAIWEAGQSLMSFVGDPDAQKECFACGGVDRCKDDCPISELEGGE